jgi:hypothetical protein
VLFPALVQIALDQAQESRPMVEAAVAVLGKALADEDAPGGVLDAESGFRYQRKDVPERRSVIVRIAAPKGQEFLFRDLLALNSSALPAVWVYPDADCGRVIQATMMASAAQAIVGGEA